VYGAVAHNAAMPATAPPTLPRASDAADHATAAGPASAAPLDLAALQATLREFAQARDWPRFHTPKNLAMALMVEAAELAEIFQWLTPEQSASAGADPATHQQIADEVADVLLYLLQLADHSGIDLASAVQRKLVKNAIKHPVGRPPLA